MTSEFVLILIAGAFSGGFINGMAGFGTSLFALGWWLQIMPPAQAVAMALVMSVASGLQGVVLVRHAIEWRRLGVFLLPAIVGIPIGLQILDKVDATLLKMVIAGFMLLYGGFFIWRRDLPNLTKPTPVLDGAIGFVSGILGAVAGLSGALPTMWLSMRDWAKEKSRAVLQPFNVVVLGLAAAMLAIDGVYDRQTLITMAIALPATMIAAQIGIRAFKVFTDAQFRRLLIIMMFLSGVLIVAKEVL